MKKLKLAGMVAVLCGYILQSLLMKMILFFSPKLNQRWTSSSIYFWGVLIRKVLGIKVKVVGKVKTQGGVLSVSNHPSYLDFFVVPAVGGLCYVSPMDLIAESRFFGVLVKSIGCILVNRKSRENQEMETKQIRDALQNGIVVHFFPEAKTTDGTEILRFRRPLFKPAIDLDTPVQVVTINYLTLDGKVVSSKNKDDIHWYRQNPINEHFWNFLQYKEIVAEVIVERKSVEELSSTHEHIADACHEIVTQNFKFYKGNE